MTLIVQTTTLSDLLSDPVSIERFRRLQEPGNDSDCWPWPHLRDRHGYGRITVHNRSRLAHRVAFAIFTQSDPVGVAICHHCDNRGCTNHAHLFSGSIADNARDMVQKGRHGHGDSHASAKLSSQIVIAIRKRYSDSGISYSELGAEYGVHESEVGRIVRGYTWPDAGGPITQPWHAPSKVSLEQADSIRAGFAVGESKSSLAREFGISVHHVCRIIKGEARSADLPHVRRSLDPGSEMNPAAIHLAMLEKQLERASQASGRLREALVALPAGSSRKRTKAANARCMRAAEHRDRVAAQLELARAAEGQGAT